MKKNNINRTFEKYHFRPYSAQSKNLFRQEKVNLQRLLGPSASVFHVGSTAIPGIGGKGILDVLITVPKATTRRAVRILEKEGYIRKKTTKHPTRIFFAKDISVRSRSKRMHVHLTHKGSKVERSMLALCHYLQIHPDEAKEYASLKRKAAERAKGRGGVYRAMKSRYVSELTKKAVKENLYKS